MNAGFLHVLTPCLDKVRTGAAGSRHRVAGYV